MTLVEEFGNRQVKPAGGCSQPAILLPQPRPDQLRLSYEVWSTPFDTL